MRTTIVCDDIDGVLAVLDCLNSFPGIEIVRVKNRLDPAFDDHVSLGYRDLLLNVQLESRFVTEVQVTLANFYATKAGGGHGAYKVLRSIGVDGDAGVSCDRIGAFSVEDAKYVANGLCRSLRLEGTAITHVDLLLKSLASSSVRLRELWLGSCTGLQSKSVAEVLSEQVCSALGVLVTTIDISNTSVDGPIPDHLFQCHKLSFLSLSANSISGEIPPSIGALTGLRSFHCRKNRLSGALPHALGDCCKLHTIDASHNQLTGSIDPLARLERLRVARLSSNRLTGPLPETFASATILEELYMDGNNLSGVRLPDWTGGRIKLEAP